MERKGTETLEWSFMFLLIWRKHFTALDKELRKAEKRLTCQEKVERRIPRPKPRFSDTWKSAVGVGPKDKEGTPTTQDKWRDVKGHPKLLFIVTFMTLFSKGAMT